MGKLKSLFAGVVLGAGGMYGGLQYHLLQAEEGFLIVPRAPQQRIQDAYADIREWDAATWTARPRMALAVTEYGRADLIRDKVSSGILDELRETFSMQEQLGEAVSHGWEPATTSQARGSISPPAAGRRTAPAQSADPPAVRRGFLPLADLFGFGKTPQGTAASSAAGTDPTATQVLPAGVTRPKPVEILPPPAEFEILDGPGSTDLGPAAPIPGSHHIDRRRSDASGWQPLSVQSF